MSSLTSWWTLGLFPLWGCHGVVLQRTFLHEFFREHVSHSLGWISRDGLGGSHGHRVLSCFTFTLATREDSCFSTSSTALTVCQPVGHRPVLRVAWGAHI